MKTVSDAKKATASKTSASNNAEQTAGKSVAVTSEARTVVRKSDSVSVEAKSDVAKTEKITEYKPVIPSMPVSTKPSGSGSISIHSDRKKVRCALCGIIEMPECEKCKFRDKDRGISGSHDSEIPCTIYYYRFLP